MSLNFCRKCGDDNLVCKTCLIASLGFSQAEVQSLRIAADYCWGRLAVEGFDEDAASRAVEKLAALLPPAP